jgi:Cof subfamily protein (haloacid dehalogenase superfamily)
MMNSYQILFLDIDGTILRPDHTIEASTKEAIVQVQEKGIETVLATGRPIHEIREIGEKLNIQSYIGYNGALAIYKDEEIFAEPLKAESVQAILDVAAQHGHELVLYTKETNYFTTLDTPNVEKFISTFDLKNNKLFTKGMMDQILGITIMSKGENDHRLYSLGNGIHLSQVHVNGMRHCFDVIRETVNKGVGIEYLLNLLKIPREASIAFGDGMNDKEMLSYVGEGFAMGNAHENLFQYAKHTTTSVNDSGIYNGLKSLGLLKN